MALLVTSLRNDQLTQIQSAQLLREIGRKLNASFAANTAVNKIGVLSSLLISIGLRYGRLRISYIAVDYVQQASRHLAPKSSTSASHYSSGVIVRSRRCGLLLEPSRSWNLKIVQGRW